MDAPKLFFSLLLLGGSLFVSGCASSKAEATQQDAVVWAAGDTTELVFSCEEPMPVLDFIKWAQMATGRRFVVNAQMVKDTEISLVGEIRCRKDQVGPFIETMLYTKGLALKQRNHGDLEVLEVVAIES